MFVSIIIPVHNGGRDFMRCLTAVSTTTYPHYELIVVDDGSSDGSADIAQRHGARLLTTQQLGPAAARNLGAQAAQGELLFFLDADIAIRPHTVTHLVATMHHHPTIVACFGSYDNTPAAHSALSRYRNLLHHHTHQSSSSDAATFWSGCGAIYRAVFLQSGGFDATQFPRPSIEDIELGYRLRAAGYGIRLEKSLQVTHLKRWTAVSILHTDIYRRALPWSRLLARSSQPANHLNLNQQQQVSAVIAWLLLLTLPLPWVWLGLTAVFLHLNHPFHRLLWRQGGLHLLAVGLFWHWLYFLYSSLTFVVAHLSITHLGD